MLDEKDPEDLTEEEKIALLGRPCCGANTRIQIRIRESKEFKVILDSSRLFEQLWTAVTLSDSRAQWTR